MFKSLVPSKVYKDVCTGSVVAVSYGSVSGSNINEILFSVEKANELCLQDCDILDCLDLPCIDVFLGKRSLVFPVSSELRFDPNLVDDGVIATLDTQTIFGHVFDKFSGIEMDCEDSIQRYISNYEEGIKSSNRQYK